LSVWRIRDFHSDDLDGILHLWEELTALKIDPVYGLSEVLASCEKDQAVVAMHGDEVIGAAVGRAAHAQGWIVFLTTALRWQNQGIGSAMLGALEKRMAPFGLAKLSALLPESANRVDAFVNRGFEVKKNLRYFERHIPVQREELRSLAELGGRMLPRDLWEGVGGMQREKELLERRLVMPLAKPEMADQYGVVPPKAVVLFGPPGTGKTTFAKAIASRLDWPFVEVFPSRLAADPKGLAGALRETFLKVSELEHVVVFIDEVEEIAAQRGGEPPSALQGVTNELLKIIPAFREQPGRLLVCATNFIRALDSALLRHGRFDYVVPIGLPDAAARHAIWERYIPAGVTGLVDLDVLVSSSEGFSPADVEYAARRASQEALERALFDSVDAAAPANPADSATSAGPSAPPGPSAPAGPTTEDYLSAIRSTRTTVSAQVAAEFLEDIERLARL
jgi:transitional endoplasmic reticulum ATPase